MSRHTKESSAGHEAIPLSSGHAGAGLKRVAFRGVSISLAFQGVRLATSLVSAVVLARLLSPEDFGLVAIVTSVTSAAAVLQLGGLSVATIQRDDVTAQQISNLFWLNAAVGMGLFLAVASAAPLVSSTFRDERLLAITLILATTLALSALTIQHRAIAMRQMRFGVVSAVDTLAMVLGVAAGVVGAYHGLGYWALVGIPVTSTLVSVVAVWSAVPWVPGRYRRGQGTRPLLVFGTQVSAGSVITQVVQSADRLLIGAVWGPALLGHYSRAQAILTQPMQQITQPVGAVVVPALSRLARDRERFRRAFLMVFSGLSLMLMLPAAVGVVAAEDLVRLVLGPGWGEAARVFSALSILIMTQPLVNSIGWSLQATGQGRALLELQVVGQALVLASVVAGLPFGPVGVATSYAVSGVVIRAPYVVWKGTREGPLSVRDLLGAAWPFAAAAAASVAAMLVAQDILVESASHAAKLLVSVASGAAAYGATLAALAPARAVCVRLVGDAMSLVTGSPGTDLKAGR